MSLISAMPNADVITMSTMPSALPHATAPGAAASSGSGSPSRGSAEHSRRTAYAYLLLARFALLNLVGAALAVAAYFQGWVDIIRGADTTYQSGVIATVFLVGLGMCATRVWHVTRELNEVGARDPKPGTKVAQYLALIGTSGREGRTIAAEALRLKLVSRIVVIRHFANTLVILGLLGTVVGFIISLGGVKPEVATNASAVTPMIATLVQGMSVALSNTLIGGVLNVWLNANYYILAAGTAQLICALLERGEAHVAR
jgi:hypothetical protein